MANASNLASRINSSINYQDEYLIKKWNSIKQIIKDKYITSTNEISPIYADKYKFDLYGLFSQYFMIPEQYIYPHIIANDYDSSSDYDGSKLRFKILDTKELNYYYKLFVKNRNR